jgi:outer membrane protein TolC
MRNVGFSQSNIEKVLNSVAANNKTLQTETRYLEAQNMQYRVGLTPPNPEISYDYMIGRPTGAGNQTDFTINQSFDFPTVYAKKRALSGLQQKQSNFQMTRNRQEVLLSAKNICLEIVYRQKLSKHLQSLKENSNRLLATFQTRLEKGEGTIMDINKTKLQALELSKQLNENGQHLTLLHQQLQALNGGENIMFADSLYPVLPEIPPFEILESEIEATDPTLKLYQQQSQIANQALAVTKVLTLPKLEGGYHYQGILGQRFNGVHLGLSIPLWEKKNTVETQKINVLHSESVITEHRNEHYYEIKNLYEKYEGYSKILNEYQEVLPSITSVQMLEKALQAGQITTIEYILESNYYNNVVSNVLSTEFEMQKAVAGLNKYKL